MTEIDIQTAQLIIQLARDDLYGLDGSSDDAALSDLEFALAAQEHEFMERWMDYGDAQVWPGNRLSHTTGSGGRDNLGNTATSPVSPVPQPVPITVNSGRGRGVIVRYPGSSSPHRTFSYINGTFGEASDSLFSTTAQEPDESPEDDDEEEESYRAPGPSTRPALSTLTFMTANRSPSPSTGSTTTDEPPMIEWTAYEGPIPDSTGIIGEPFSDNEEDSNDEEGSNDEEDSNDEEASNPSEHPNLSIPGSSPRASHVATPTTEEGSVQLVDFADYIQYTLQQPISPISSAGHSDSENEDNDPRSLLPLFHGEGSEGEAGPSSQAERFSRILEEYFRSGSVVEVNTPLEPRVECTFCKEQCSTSSALSTSCSHYVCRSCVTRNVELCTRDETAYPPKCCNSRLPTRDLIDLLKDPKLSSKYEAKAIEYSTPIRDRVYCCKCADFLGSRATGTSGSSSSSTLVSSSVLANSVVASEGKYCSHCRISTCSSCRQASHPHRPCQDTPLDVAFKRLTAEKGWQKCPNCDAVVELHVGCYHIKCRCATEFCYLCATRWKGCNCPNADEDRLIL